MQFDEDQRGFSFQKEGPLDMRMDQTATTTAKDVVNNFSREELGTIFREYGEERLWRKAAKAIVEERKKKPIETTKELADVVAKASKVPGKKIHPATKIFQAIRICINRELESIEGSLKKAINLLAPGGQIGVLSFHSLEDRIVKNVFRDAAKDLSDVHGRILKKKAMQVMTKKPKTPSLRESRVNRRARSAKLRVARKI